MNYKLTNSTTQQQKGNMWKAFKRLWVFLAPEKPRLIFAFTTIIVTSAVNIYSPFVLGKAIDEHLLTRDFDGVVRFGFILAGMYVFGFITQFIQTRMMGGVGQRVLFSLRNSVFNKLQELPVAFFNQNKAGDLISRINNDTDKLNQFFSQVVIQFFGNVFVIIGAGIAMLVVNPRLGGAALIPAAALLVFTQLTSAWIKKRNFQSMQKLGDMSGEIQENLENFKVIIAFNRHDYFRRRFQDVNKQNYEAALKAGIANNTYVPIYGFSSNIGQLIVITYGLTLISTGDFTIGLLVSFLAYVSRFYDPLRQMAALWANFQTALAAWDRISEILSLKSNLVTITDPTTPDPSRVLEFKHVHFAYPDGKNILHDVNFTLQRGKTYALVGPTGGGKTTTASLMARLYDPTSGSVTLVGKDIRSYDPSDRVKKIGFILQDPFLFSGTVKDNILYGNETYRDFTNEQLTSLLKKDGLDELLMRFDQGLDTPIAINSDSVSLGQKQLVAFIRAVLRHPDILILDEATANIDTVTEQLLEKILAKLPATTTKVIIAHRLNTIEHADEIFFVNSGTVTAAGSLDHAVTMLAEGTRKS